MRTLDITRILPWAGTIALILVFDSFIASSSVIPLRFVYDIGFGLVAAVLAYISIFLITGRGLVNRDFGLTLSRKAVLGLSLVNLKWILSVIGFEGAEVGYLSGNVLSQSVEGLLPLLDYLSMTFLNGFLLSVVLDDGRDVEFSRVACYAIAVVSFQVCASAYGFHLLGGFGLKLMLLIFYATVMALTIRKVNSGRFEEVRLRATTEEITVACISVGVFMMCYSPFSMYSLFGDQAVVMSSALSMSYRGSLDPFYFVTDQYISLGGFVALSFAYTVGLKNVMLASTLPFLLAHISLPLVSYRWFKRVLHSNGRLAIVGAMISTSMDGPAVLLLPAFVGHLTMQTINCYISPMTGSLYSSTLRVYWLIPYQALSLASAVGALAILEKRTKTDLAISGMLLFLSFADPRFSFATVLGLVFLFCIRRLRLPDLGVVTLALLGALGPEIPHVAYKTIVGAIGNVSTVIQIDKGINTQLLGLAEAILHLDSNVVLLAGLGAFAFLLAVANVGSSQELFKQDTGLWDLEEVEHTHISLKASGLEIASYEADDIIIPILGLITLVYIILYSYGKLGPPLWGLLNSGFFGFFNYLVLRYHVVLLLGIFTLYSYRKSGRLSLALAFVLGLSLIGLLFRLDAPLLITLTALPALQHISQSRHHIAKIMVLCFLCLGVFSGTFYAATATSVSSDPRYDDLPHILPILFTIKGGENVYTPSSYSYYARRLLSFAQLRLDTKNSSCSYWLIDINFISKAKLQEILSDKTFEVLYAGDSFVLLKR